MLREGFPLEVISKITKLPLVEIQQLKESIFPSSKKSETPIENTVIVAKSYTQDKLRDTWINEGKKEAKQEDALAMLREGFPLEVISKITKLSLEEIKKLQSSQDK